MLAAARRFREPSKLVGAVTAADPKQQCRRGAPAAPRPKPTTMERPMTENNEWLNEALRNLCADPTRMYQVSLQTNDPQEGRLPPSDITEFKLPNLNDSMTIDGIVLYSATSAAADDEELQECWLCNKIVRLSDDPQWEFFLNEDEQGGDDVLFHGSCYEDWVNGAKRTDSHA